MLLAKYCLRRGRCVELIALAALHGRHVTALIAYGDGGLKGSGVGPLSRHREGSVMVMVAFLAFL